ncbi:MAG: tRNA pseudouridine(55) synthase TruB [Sphingomonadaceae bacterium]
MSGLHGFLVIDKPEGPTSAAVVARLKRALKAGGHGGVKIGHGGTLDPLATGVLPVALGEATKLLGHLLNGPKAYRFTVAFGAETATGDREGAVTATTAARPTRNALLAVVASFSGPIRQVPPAYSAVKIGGRAAHRRARAGEEVAIPAREVVIHALELEASDGETATLSVRCSKGTYVRALAADLARAAGSLGHVVMLRRTAAGPFGEEQALALDKAAEMVQGPAPEQALLPLAAGLDDIPVLAVDAGEAARLKVGQVLPGPRAKSGLHLATLGSVPVALVEVSPTAVSVVRGLNMD